MIRVLATDGIEKSAIAKLESKGIEVVEKFYEPDVLGEELKNYEVVVVRSATKVREPIIDKALEGGRLQLIIRGGVGVDNIDVAYAKSKGLTVANTPNASSASVAELAIAHMFAVARYIHIANHTMREGKWNKKHYEGSELAGKTLGLIGFGRIGQETAKRALALGMNVIYTDLAGAKEGVKDCKFVSFDEVLSQAEFISLHIPGNKDKSPVIGAAEFAKMKDGVFVINTARGGVVSEDDLIIALDSGKVKAAALDVFAEEPTKNEKIYTHDKISLTPHIGAATGEAQERIGEEIVQIILKHFNL